MRAVTMRTGALGRLELITRIPGHASIAAAGFPIIDRSSTPLTLTDVGRELIREAHQIL